MGGAGAVEAIAAVQVNTQGKKQCVCMCNSIFSSLRGSFDCFFFILSFCLCHFTTKGKHNNGASFFFSTFCFVPSLH